MNPTNLHITAALFLAISLFCVWAFLSILIAAFRGKVIAGNVNRNESPGVYWAIVLVSGFALVPTAFILVLSLAHFVLRLFHA
jgi:hypothetical protein